jgi:hypothetical protein
MWDKDDRSETIEKIVEKRVKRYTALIRSEANPRCRSECSTLFGASFSQEKEKVAGSLGWLFGDCGEAGLGARKLRLFIKLLQVQSVSSIYVSM